MQLSNIRILVTGGTFDKEYDEINGKLFFRDTHLHEMLALGRSQVSVVVEKVIMIDSNEICGRNRIFGFRSAPWFLSNVHFIKVEPISDIDIAYHIPYCLRMAANKQLNFSHQSSKFRFVKNTAFGGAKFENYNPSSRRPLASRTPIHLVFRSEIAKGKYSLLNFDKKVRRIVDSAARTLGIQIKNFANVGNHIHLVVILPNLRVWRRFICSITGLIARLVLGAERGQARNVKFWQGRPWTRLVAWGKDLRGVTGYLHLNKLEALGFSRKSVLVIRSMKLDDVKLC